MRQAALEIARQSDAFAPSMATSFFTAVARPFTRIKDIWTLTKLRDQLHSLDERQLEDIGILRSDIDQLGHDGLGAAGALARLVLDRRTASIAPHDHRRAGQCAWVCTRR